MIRGFLKTAAAAAAIAAMPAAAVAASPAASLSVAASANAAAALQEEDNQIEGLSAYALPIGIVIVIGLAFYFGLEDGGDEAPASA